MMIDKSLKIALTKKNGRHNFKKLLEFMEASGIDFKDRKIKFNTLGVATMYGLFINSEELNRYNDSIIFYVILHEIAHYKRIQKMGKEALIKALSAENFETFFEHVVGEEIIADRYASLLYLWFNKETFPSIWTQELFKEDKRNNYRPIAARLFGVIKNDEENYKNLLESFLV